jgi:hypothetical protein
MRFGGVNAYEADGLGFAIHFYCNCVAIIEFDNPIEPRLINLGLCVQPTKPAVLLPNNYENGN